MALKVTRVDTWAVSIDDRPAKTVAVASCCASGLLSELAVTRATRCHPTGR